MDPLFCYCPLPWRKCVCARCWCLAARQEMVGLLPSGWDERSERIFNSTMQQLAHAPVVKVHYRAAATLHDTRIGPVKVHQHFWRPHQDYWHNAIGGAENWEPNTFREFSRRIHSGMTYVGFGTWIGPTLLFAAQLADRSFGIEGDPAAFAGARSNLALNSDDSWARRAFVQPACVATDEMAGTQEMASAAAGDSCSGLNKSSGCFRRGHAPVKWQVRCYSLPYLFAKWRIATDATTFIKIDVEGFECKLLPSLAGWLGESKDHSKPTLHFALHAQTSSCTSDEQAAILRLSNQYRHAYCTSGQHQGVEWTAMMNRLPCPMSEVVFSDV